MARFCANCGSQINDGVKFCASCGQAQPVVPVISVVSEVPQPMQQKQKQQKQQKNKTPFIIAGVIIVFAVFATVLILIIANLFGYFNKPGDRDRDRENEGDSKAITSGGNANINTYEIFGDGELVEKPQRLKAKASSDDGISKSALVGPWEGTRSSINTEYGFSDDGYFYKNVMITHTHIRSIYHSGYWEYGAYYDTYHYGWTDYSFDYSYTYLDTLIGEYRIKGGVIEFDHVVAVSRTVFEDDWYYEKTRSVSIEQLQKESKNASFRDDFSLEFEFINSTRVRFRDESDDIDLFWDINTEDDPHNVEIPQHEIPAVDWPSKALSLDMPDFKTKGRLREASLSYSGDDKNIKSEFKTVTVVIDKTSALSEINAYGSDLKKSGWWVEDYEFGEESEYLSYEARKGMFLLDISNGRGSGTSFDTIVIESTKYPEGKWIESWSAAGLEPPDGSVIVGDIKIDLPQPEQSEQSNQFEDKNIYEDVIFDKVDDKGVDAYMNKLVKAGFKKPQYSYNDWDMMKYIRIDGDLYLARIQLKDRMDSLTSFNYDLTYVPDGVWSDSWKNGGLPAPDGFDTIAGEIDIEKWTQNLDEYAYATESIKFLGLDDKETESYFIKLKSAGFKQVEDSWSDEVRLYNYIRIDNKLLRVEVRQMDNEDITEFSYYFDYHEDGVWSDIWQTAGLPAPDGYDTIVGEINLTEWASDINDYSYDSLYIKFLGLDASEPEGYLSKLKSKGFRQVKNDWDDSVRLYNYLRIDGKLYRVEIKSVENNELTEFSYYFDYYEDGEWLSEWVTAGIPAPSFTAMLGKIDADEFNESLSDWGSYYKYIKLLDANLSDYAATLKKNGFEEPEYNWSDTWELKKRIRINGNWCNVTIKDSDNDEIPEINIYITVE